MIRKINRLSKYGLSPAEVISIFWKNSNDHDKKKLGFIDLLLTLSIKSELIGPEQKLEAFKLIKPKCKLFSDCVLVYQKSEKESAERVQFLKLAGLRAKTYDDYLWLYRETPSPVKQRKIFEILKTKASSFSDYLSLWRFTPKKSSKKKESFELLINNINSYEDCVVINMYTLAASIERRMILDLANRRYGAAMI